MDSHKSTDMKRVRSRAIGVGMLAAVLIAAALVPALAQQGGRDPDGRGGGPPADREEMRQRMMERMEEWRERQQARLREQLEMSEEEFEAVHPLIMQVRRHQREQMMMMHGRRGPGGGMGMMGGGRGRGPGDDGDDAEDRPRRGRDDGQGRGRRGPQGPRGPGDGPMGQRFELSEPAQAVREAAVSLREALQDESVSNEELQGRLDALREARSELDATLAETREQLREALTVRQEAVLVMRGVLD